MKSKVHLFLIFLIVLLINCTEKVNLSLTNYNISFNVEDKLIKVGDSTTIDLKISSPGGSDFSYEWSTNIGTIKGAGERVKFYGPEKSGTALIKATVSDGQRNSFTYTKEIVVFRQMVILKADDVDFHYLNILSLPWQTFFGFIKSKGIKSSLGLIGMSLERGTEAYYTYLKALDASGNFELWNHGYTHTINGVDDKGNLFNEFRSSPLAYQKEHLDKTQKLAKEKLNITLRAFGAPGNGIDKNTLTALDGIDDIRVWFFGMGSSPKLNLKRSIEIEHPTGNPDFQKFKDQYNPQSQFIVLQIHPNSWDKERFSEFEKCIDLLIKNDVTFLNPYEYSQLIK